MQHEAALEMLASERYVLGELSAEERDRFEEHFFSCRQCGEEVRHTVEFVENLKAVLLQQQASAPAHAAWRARLRDWFSLPALIPTAAAAALAMVVSYQQFVQIPQLRQALAPAAVATSLLGPSTRGEIPVVRLPQSAPLLLLSLEASAPASAHQLLWTVQSPSGAQIARLSSANSPIVTLRLPAATLPEGRYLVLLSTDSGELLDRYQFTLQRHSH